MARFSRNTLTKVAGYDTPVLSQEIPFGNRDFWNMQFNLLDDQEQVTGPIDLTGATITAEIIRRTITNLEETRSGLDFDLSPYPGATTTIPLTISNRQDTQGQFTLSFDSAAWDLIGSDPELVIDVQNPAAFSGQLLVSFPATGGQPAYDESVFLLFLVRNNGRGV